MQTVSYKIPILKWAGGKRRSLPHILPALQGTKRLIEPFVGSGVVFFNYEGSQAIIADSNYDLINLYQFLSDEGEDFIAACRRYFSGQYNQAEQYYALRDRFNATENKRERAALFLYLNRHGYNGLCRYNNKGGFNVPFGSHKKPPEFPERRTRLFVQRLQATKIMHQDFRMTMAMAKKGDVVYCDPPYVPLSKTAMFTRYEVNDFNEQDQIALAEEARRLQKQDVRVLVSNHDTPFTRELYQGATILSFQVARLINSKVEGRGQVAELLAVFE